MPKGQHGISQGEMSDPLVMNSFSFVDQKKIYLASFRVR